MKLRERFALARAAMAGKLDTKGFQVIGNMTAGGLLPGATFDYAKSAGDLWLSSIAGATIHWAGKAMTEAPLIVERHKPTEDSWQQVAGHALSALVQKPNPHYAGRVLRQGLTLSLMVDGNGYIYKRRAVSGRVAELWYVPHFAVSPVWTGDEFISGYRYTAFDGRGYTIPATDIVHIRDGIDPNNQRLGLSPLGAVLREVATDNECATMSAALMRNMGIPGVVITARDGQVTISAPTAEAIKAMWKDKFTGDRRGEPLVLTEPADIKPVGLSPKDLAIDVLRRVPEERITAALGVPAVVVGMGAGLDRSTFANFAEARRAAYESCVVPLSGIIAEDMTLQLLPDFGDATGLRCAFDWTQVRALQENMTEVANRMGKGVVEGWVKVSEARASQNLISDASDEVYLRPINVYPMGPGGAFSDAGDESEPKARHLAGRNGSDRGGVRGAPAGGD